MSDETPTIDQITASLEQIDTLDADGLASLATDIRAAYEAHRSGEQVDLDVLAKLAAGLDKVTEAQAAAAQAQAQLEAELAELDAKMSADEAIVLDPETAAVFADVPDEDVAVLAALTAEQAAELAAYAEAIAELAEVAAEEEPAEEEMPEEETRAASAITAPRVVRVPSLPASPVQPQPEEQPVPETPFATAHLTNTPMTEEQVLQGLLDANAAYGSTPDRPVRVASVALDPSVPRISRDMTSEQISGLYEQQLASLREHRAGAHNDTTRQASGTLCAPPLVDYSIQTLGSTEEPIGGVFPRAAGGTADQMKTLRFFQSVVFDDWTDVDTDTSWGTDAGGETAATVGTGSATATQNALALDNASSPYPKTALRANCPTYVDCEQRANWLEIVYDNLGSMAWPEFVAAVRRGGDVALARQMDAYRLQDWYDSADTSGVVLTSLDQGVSANHNYVRNILNIVQTDRSNKAEWDVTYVVAQPRWAASLLAGEMFGMAAIASGDRAITEARAQVFRDYNIVFVDYVTAFGVTDAANETEHGYPTILPALADGDAPEMPCQVRVGIARDDAGFSRIGDTLNLGVLRTETDLEDNDWRTFYETWSRLCFRIPPIVADINVNPNMLVMGFEHNPQGTAIDFCAGSGS